MELNFDFKRLSICLAIAVVILLGYVIVLVQEPAMVSGGMSEDCFFFLDGERYDYQLELTAQMKENESKCLRICAIPNDSAIIINRDPYAKIR